MRRHADLIQRQKPCSPLLLGMPMLLFVFSILLSGCHPTSEITIQVMKPARVTLPAHIHEVSFINRSRYPSRGLTEADTVSLTSMESYIVDTITQARIFQGISDALNASPLFDLQEIQVLQDRHNDTSRYREPMSAAQQERISGIQGAEALISLEDFAIRAVLDLDSDESEYCATLHLNSVIHWRIYDLTRNTLLDDFQSGDSVRWQEFGETPREAFSRLPLLADALRQSAYHAGYAYGTRIAPGWIEENRFYHTKRGREMRTAARLAASGQWEEAATIWRKMTLSDHDKQAARACFNMALSSELDDRLADALDWANRSYRLQRKRLTRDYIDLLGQRRKELERLLRQLPPGTD